VRFDRLPVGKETGRGEESTAALRAKAMAKDEGTALAESWKKDWPSDEDKAAAEDKALFQAQRNEILAQRLAEVEQQVEQHGSGKQRADDVYDEGETSEPVVAKSPWARFHARMEDVDEEDEETEEQRAGDVFEQGKGSRDPLQYYPLLEEVGEEESRYEVGSEPEGISQLRVLTNPQVDGAGP
jgi:hypothetical protein